MEAISSCNAAAGFLDVHFIFQIVIDESCFLTFQLIRATKKHISKTHSQSVKKAVASDSAFRLLGSRMDVEIIEGDLLEQDVEVIVNSWNRNIIPWWLLLPQGVSGAIKKQGGLKPFIEVGRFGPIPLGGARITSAGKLPYKAIIHVAGINMLWFATDYSVKHSVINAMQIVNAKGYKSVAFPLIGSGSGSRGKNWSLGIMQVAFTSVKSNAVVKIVKYAK